VAKRDVEVNKVYRGEAAQLSVSWQQARASINIVDELGTLRDVAADKTKERPVFLRSTWRSLSGYQHGHGYVLIANPNVSIFAPTAGGQLARTEINDGRFQASAQAASWLFLTASRLFVRRSTRAD
jgi:hypothetical protein